MRGMDIPAGQRFTRLTVTGPAGPDTSRGGRSRGRRFTCLCDCGAIVTVFGFNLRRGTVRSCGCLMREKAAVRCRERQTTHGASRHPLYQTWSGMHSRCENPNTPCYADYGGRGISVDPRWHRSNPEGFWNFVGDIGPKPGPTFSVERLDNDGPYSAENTKWATSIEQNVNKRASRHVIEVATRDWCLKVLDYHATA